MSKKLRLLMALLIVGCQVYHVDKYQLDAKATADAPYEIGEKIALCQSGCDTYRKFMGVTLAGYYLVQDFDVKSDVKRSEPFLIMESTELGVSYPFKIDGVFLSYYENGGQREQGLYNAGRRNGLWRGWHLNGQKWYENTYRHGELIGHTLAWYDNGMKTEEGFFDDNGVRIGFWYRWWEDGKLLQITYNRYLGEGYTLAWHRDGSLWVRCNYSNGLPLKGCITWDEKGAVAFRGE